MSEHNISVQAGQSLRLLTAGKYCDRDIVVTADGSSGGSSGGGQIDALLDGTITALDSNAAKIHQYACRAREGLVTVNLPEATEIETYAFYGCKGLTTFTAPKMEILGTQAFAQCSAATEFIFPRLTKLSDYEFNGCSALKKADIGLVSSVPRYTFGSCKALETVIVRSGSVPTLNSAAFSSANFAGYIYVPAALVDSYKTASYWSNYTNQYRAIEDYPDICGA